MNKKLITISLILILVATTACNHPKESAPEPPSPEISSIMKNHPDIYIPADTAWNRTLYSGEIEQHELSAPCSAAEFFQNTKTAMEEYEWTLKEENLHVLRFTKSSILVSYSIKNNLVNYPQTELVLFIEPENLYN
ncbi:MAG: hypothetical protein ABII07_02835 [Patescibacteria group bacterium]|nr:hypothetical protein [Patescibacteria group bacterium]